MSPANSVVPKPTASVEPRRPDPAPEAASPPLRVSTQLAVLTNPGGAEAESVRALRTHLMAQHFNLGRRALAVCAPSAGVGCTFLAANLAVALSQIGVNTLLLEADLRAPALDRMLPPRRPGVGLNQLLSDVDFQMSDAVEREVIPNLSVMYAGTPSAHGQELLASDRFAALMNACLRDFDATIVDTAPANKFADARRVSTVVGYSLIVARKDETYARDVRVLAQQLAADHAQVVGTVLNEA